MFVSVVPGFVANPYLEDPFDDIDNQDKYLLHSTSIMYFNIQIYSNNPISSQNFVHPIYSHPHCIDFVHNLIVDNIYNYSEYASYTDSLHDNSTNSFVIHHRKHVGTSFDQPRYTKFVHTYIRHLSRSLLWLKGSHYYAAFCLKRLVSIVRNVWEIDPCIYRMIARHGMVNECRSEVWKRVVVLKEGASIIPLSPLRFFSGLLRGDPIEGWLNVLVGYLDDIRVTLIEVDYLIRSIKGVLKFNMSVVGSYVKNSSEQLDSIKSSIRYLVSYIEPIRNILRYIKEKINKGGCLSISIDDLGWEQKYLGCSESVKIAISSLKYIQSYIDNSFHTIDLIESSTSILKRQISVLENVNIELGSLIYRAIHIVNRLVKACKYIKKLQETIDKLLEELGGTVILLYQHHTEYVPMMIKNKIGGLLKTIELYIKVGDDLISKLSTVYSHNKHNINQLELFTGLIELAIKKVGSVITCFNVSNKQNIRNLELWYKYILKQFTGNSLISTIKFLKDCKNITGSTGNTLFSESIKTSTQDKYIPAQTKNPLEIVWSILSHISMMEPENVLLKLYECHKKKEKIEEILKMIVCECTLNFDCKDHPYYSRSSVSSGLIPQNCKQSIENLVINNEQNHVCMCLVMIYHVYPMILKYSCFIYDIIRDLSSCCSRNFKKFTESYTLKLYRAKLALLFVEIVEIIFIAFEKGYMTIFHVTECGAFRCFCTSPDTKQYLYFICIMIYICSLLESTTWSDENIEYNISHIIHLLSDLEGNDLIIGKKNLDNESQIGGTSQNSEKNQAKPSVKVDLKPFKTARTYYYMTTGTRYSNQTNLTFGDLGESNELRITHKLRLSIRYDVVHREHFAVTVSFPFTDKEKVCEKIKGFSSSLCSGSVGTSRTSNNGCTCNRCHGCVILKPSLNLFYRNRDSILMQLSENSIISFLVELEYRFPELKTLYYIIEKILNDCKTITIISRNNRMCDSTSVITNNKFEVGSNNNYTYNDAYRINTSRAHGSLKYIIIKIVLILMIVVMTIFVRVKIEINEDYIK